MTNKGVGGLLKKWGEGASLIRKEWKTREENDEGGKKVVDTKSHRAGGDDEMAVDDEDDEEDDEDEDDEEEEEEEPDLETTPRMLPRRTIGVHSPQLSSHPNTDISNDRDGSNNDLTNLTESLNSLSIVPTSIRFGRGGKSGGFIPRGQGRARGGKHGRTDRGRGGGLPPRANGGRRDGYVANTVTVTRQ